MAQSRAVLPKAGVVERRPVEGVVHRSPAAAAGPLQALQQRMGHQASQALIQRASEAGVSSKATRLAHVSSPRDASEREAEEMARKVTRMREPAPAPGGAKAATPAGTVQREAAAAPASSPAPAPAAARSVPGAGPGAPLP